MTTTSLVRWVGAQRDVLGGDIGGHIALTDLATVPHLYALGPLEGVRGEVTVFDGIPHIARVVDGRVTVESRRDVRACFLVYASVRQWREMIVASPLRDVSEIDKHLWPAAAGWSLEGPLPFLLRGITPATVCHVLDKRDGLPHTPERHEQAKLRFAIEAQSIEAIGFHSERHRGIFTPRESNTHIHLRTTDGEWSGHVEELQLAPGWRLSVPRRTPDWT